MNRSVVTAAALGLAAAAGFVYWIMAVWTLPQ